MTVPLETALLRALLLKPAAVQAGLGEIDARRNDSTFLNSSVQAAVARGLPPALPNLWQTALGVLRMQHRLLARRGTVGLSALPRQPGALPWLLEHQLVRLPVLLWDRSVVPSDLSGLRSMPDTLCRHLLGTHHAGTEADYDLEILACRAPQTLPALRATCAAVVSGTHPRARFWRLTCIYQGAHEALLARIDRALAGVLPGASETDDPDVSFLAFLRFCARQPKSLPETTALARRGRYHIAEGVLA
jgi:hypothetical protein